MSTSPVHARHAAGIVVSGGRVASGLSETNPFPSGTIALQLPHFRERGLDLSGFYLGTINVSIAPYKFSLIGPIHTFRDVKWLDTYPPEHFSFAEIVLLFGSQRYEGLVYYPHPETKISFEKDNSVLEILAPFVPNLSYGSTVELLFPTSQIVVE